MRGKKEKKEKQNKDALSKLMWVTGAQICKAFLSSIQMAS